ncbi:DUF2515 family protein [Shouchella patagoniensis]|uniref:DUF2515 family protein n=1 Tax=Shouchella patagoniensis TaxID=228576 RepID=UPI000995B096|nr:DUF2515 family protein [Shouchella patagoniensis]
MKDLITFANVDNISRTKAYEQFGRRYPEIRWAALAGMVSRNAGWNMTDLTTAPFRTVLNATTRRWIGWIYERANWIIFADAYPQLLVYQQTVQKRRDCFDTLKSFGVSSFMQKEWRRFMVEENENRLMTALIINEQFVVQNRLLDLLAMEQFFHSAFYNMQEFAHFSHVILPGINQTIYGETVTSFANPIARIQLGKRLAKLLYEPELQEQFFAFTKKTEPTGSRRDYNLNEDALPLRLCFPRCHHRESDMIDWYENKKPDEIERLFKQVWMKPKRGELGTAVTKAEIKLLSWMKGNTN